MSLYNQKLEDIGLSAYFIANIRINDDNEYQKYLEGVDKVFNKYDGEYLVVDNNPTIIEGKWDYSRLVLIEFPDKDSLKKWYYSDDYQTILKYRLLAAECDTIMAD